MRVWPVNSGFARWSPFRHPPFTLDIRAPTRSYPGVVASERKMRKFVRQWRRRYPYPLDWVDDRANKQCRRSELAWLSQFEGVANLRRRDVVALVEWALGDQPASKEFALKGLAGPAEWGHARRRIKKALATANPIGALDCLLGEEGGIPGWEPAMASVVLAVCRPATYVVADERAMRTLAALELCSPTTDGEFGRGDWWPYLRTWRKLAELCGLSLRDVHHALWAGADEAPSLLRSPKPLGRQARV